jgi:nucleotidyltransferase substrate binding protein (TIGR01987 family)
MEILKKKYKQLLDSLGYVQDFHKLCKKEAIDSLPYIGFRHATISSFNIAYEVFWKYFQHLLNLKYGIEDEIDSPKGVFRKLYEIKLINDSELKELLKMSRLRNLAVHVYSASQAEEIADEVYHMEPIMIVIAQRLSPEV